MIWNLKKLSATWMTNKCLNYRNSHPWEYAVEMLIVPPSMVSSSSFSLSLAIAPSTVVHDLAWHNWDWVWDDVFSASDGSLGGAWGNAPPFRTGEKKFGCSDMGKVIPLFVIGAVLVSNSTGFWAFPGIFGDTDICFSSNFAAKTNGGPDPPFKPWEWSKLSPIWWLFPWFKWKEDSLRLQV